MYRGTISDYESPLMKHLETCVYALLYFRKLSTMTSVQAMTMMTKHSTNRLRIRRFGGNDPVMSAKYFEYTSREALDKACGDEDVCWHIHTTYALARR